MTEPDVVRPPVMLAAVIQAALGQPIRPRLIEIITDAFDAAAGGPTWAVHNGILYPAGIVVSVALTPQDAANLSGAILEVAIQADAMNGTTDLVPPGPLPAPDGTVSL